MRFFPPSSHRFVNEGLGYNPVVFDLMYQMGWRERPVNLHAWIVDYADQRYGQSNLNAAEAWRQILATVYRAPAGGRSMIDRLPTLQGGQSGVQYSNVRLAEAWHALLQASDQLGDVDTYWYDLVNVNRQVLSNHRQWMVQWSDGKLTYPIETRGDSVAWSSMLWQKYGDTFKPDAVSLSTGKPFSCLHPRPTTGTRCRRSTRPRRARKSIARCPSR